MVKFNDGDVCQAVVVAKHNFFKNDKGTHVLEFPCEIVGKAVDNENTAEGFEALDPAVKRNIPVYISPKAKTMAIKNLKILGLDREKLTVADINPASDTVHDFTGSKFLVTVKIDEKYGLKFEIGGGVRAKPTAESLAQLDNLLGGEADEDPFSKND
jgi:hypothetical protein